MAHGHKFMANRMTCKHAHRYRYIGWAKSGNPDIGNGFATLPRENRQCVDVAGFTLIGGHALRGVAFKQFDRIVTFLCGQIHIADLHVVLLIDELFVRFVVRGG